MHGRPTLEDDLGDLHLIVSLVCGSYPFRHGFLEGIPSHRILRGNRPAGASDTEEILGSKSSTSTFGRVPRNETRNIKNLSQMVARPASRVQCPVEILVTITAISYLAPGCSLGGLCFFACTRANN
jgi:hypothetical protein